MRKPFILPVILFFAFATARSEQAVFSEIMYHPTGTKPEYIEIWNCTMTPLDMAQWRFTDGVSYEFPDFNAGAPQDHFLKPLERIVISAADAATTRVAYGISPAVRVFGPWTGALENAGERITLADKNGVTVTTVKYGDGGRWPKAADGAGHSLVLRNENNPIDSWHNWHQSQFRNGSPGGAEFTAVEPFGGNPEVAAGTGATVFDYGTTWKYSQPATDPGTLWRTQGFDDTSWASGPGLIGFETAPLPAPGIQTPFGASGPITYLFRKTFTFSGNPLGATVSIDQVLDDGAAYYLNGNLLPPVGYNPGGAWDQTSSRTIGDATEELNAVSGAAMGLVNGTNTIAVEVHQTSNTSSDMVFGARLKISTTPSVVINEVKPGAAGAGFVEFFNTTASPIDLNGYYLSDTPGNLTKFQITTSTVVPANSYAMVGFAESNLVAGATTVVYLTQPNGTTVINAISAAMPLDGRSLGRNPAGSTMWFLFAIPTPLAPNGSISAGGASVRLSEAHFAPNGRVDWIELQNTSGSPQPMSGLFLASLADFSDKIALTGSVAGGGYGSFTCDFAADASGDVTLYLIDSQNNVLGVAELEHVAGLNSIQAVWPTPVPTLPAWETVKTVAEWFSTATDTRDAANAVTPTTSIVINEIMCDPPSEQAAGEFIELYNKSGAAVNLAGWKLRGGVDFDFGAASIPAGGYLVVGGNVAYLQSAYPGATIVGNWSGTLGNKGDLLRLIDANGNLADEVDYHTGGDWPDLSVNRGSSLELVHPDMDNSRASAWRASDETHKTTFQTFTITGTYAQLQAQGVPSDYKELHFFATKDAHFALRNIQLRLNGTGPNLLTNTGTIATDGSSASGWLCQGTHGLSFIDGSGDLHIVADSHGDNRPNRVEIDCTGIAQGLSYTLSFEARWVSGANRLIAQLWDHSIGKALLIPMPNNLGTAGAANSRVNVSALPQVDSILHSPAVPKPTEPVKVTARIYSVVPLTAVEVLHRADDINNANSYVAAPMFDDGTNGDAVAGDGLYTATITAHQVNGRVVQFYVRATAAGGATAQAPPAGDARPAMWVVDNRTIGTELRRQRLIISAYDRDALATASGLSPKFNYRYPRLANRYFPAVFIHNEQDVYYLAELHKSGSPWTRSDGNELDRGKWRLPDDRIFRNRQKTTFDNDAEGGNRHHNRLVRYLLYLCGFPASNQEEFAYMVVNTDGLHVRNDTEPTDSDLLDRSFGNGTDGQLVEVEDEWWFTDAWGQTPRDADWLYKGTDEPIRYHTEYAMRSRDIEYDFSSLIEMFKQVNNGAVTDEQLARIIDPQFMMIVAAVRGYAGDWDSQTVNRGKNCYLYRKPSDGRWMYLHWDSDLAWGSTTEAVVGGIGGWSTYAARPAHRRILNFYLTELVNKWTAASGRASAWLDAEENASTAYTVDKAYYLNFFSGRAARVLQEINTAVGAGGTANAYTVPFAVSTAGGTTAANTITLTGTAPSSAFRVAVLGHPEGVFSWINQTTWQISGIVLATGLNTFTVQTFDQLGNMIATTTYSTTKTGNAPPVMALAIDPPSQNAVLGAPVLLDASASYDPDAGALGVAWSVPASGVNVTTLSASSRRAVFTTPGVYSFTATGTDPGAAATPITREITAYNAEDFASFSGDTLEPFWTASNLEPRDSYSPSAYYSLEDTPNNLVVQVLADSAKPLNFAAPTHPLLQRPLPTTADFSLQTDLTLEARRTGTFMTGLYVEMVESGATIRYAFGFDGGNSIAVKRLTSASITTLVTQASTGVNAILRARRVGTQLRFERRTAGVWTTIRTQTLPAGASAVKGGIFVSTTAAENVRVAFDYVLLADPANNNTVLNNLRITEVMYHPKAPGTVEFIEVRNIGAQTINLNGVKFDQGAPFDAFTFGNVSLAPGQFAVVTNDSAAFLARYGFAATAQWPGGVLSDGGETITLRDADGNPVHDFDYDDVAPWPLTPDGSGPSLEVIDVNGNYGLGTNWRASWEDGGSPGWQGAGPDSDGDGQPDSWEAMFGTGANDPSSYYRAGSSFNGSGQPVLSWPSVAGRNYRIEYCDSLTPPTWQTLVVVGGTASTTTYTDTTTPRPPQRFYKITALP